MMADRSTIGRLLLHMPVAWKRQIPLIVILANALLAVGAPLAQEQSPLTLAQVQSLLNIGAPDATIAHEIAARGAAFPPSVTLLNELQKANAGQQTLMALRKLIPAERTLCDSFGGCMSGGQRTFHDKDWPQARAYFEQAATISPNSGQAWDSLGKTYLALRQTEEAYSAWDKALKAGGMSLTACMEKHRPTCEGGTLRLTASTLTRYKGEDKVFESALSAVKVVGTFHHGSPSYLAFEVLVSGTKYDFDFFPITVQCVWTDVLVCPAEGRSEQAAMASYFEQTLRRLVGGSVGDAGPAVAPAEISERTDNPPVKVAVRHRHKSSFGAGLSLAVPQQTTWCEGVLTVSLGIVQYDCNVPDRTLARCEHGMISPIRSVALKGGDLRIVGQGGNWDFFGNNDDLIRARDAIAATLTQ